MSDGTLRPPLSAASHRNAGILPGAQCHQVCPTAQCTEQKCSIVQTNILFKAQIAKLYFALYCFGTMVHRRWQTPAGWHQEGLGGPGGSWASPPNTEMENLNVRKYYHSSQSVLYISTPCTVWRIELMCYCGM